MVRPPRARDRQDDPDGTLTSRKPISDDDLAAFLADCLDDPALRNRILPIGDPGELITPREQGERLFALVGRPARFRHVSVALLDGIAGALGVAGRIVPAPSAKAGRPASAAITRPNRCGLDPQTGRYDAAATPSTGSETLLDYDAGVLRGEAAAEPGNHAAF